MYRRKYSYLFIFLIITVVLIIMAFVYYSEEKRNYDRYYAILNGQETTAGVYKISGTEYLEGIEYKWLYKFEVAGREYWSVTSGQYTVRYMQNNDYIIAVKYSVGEDGKPVVEETVKDESGNEKLLALSWESIYFSIAPKPAFTAGITLFVLSALTFLFAAYNLLWVVFYKGIERKGAFTYAVFVEAFSSRFGSNRFMAIRYRYKNEKEEWIEAVSPPSFTPMKAEFIKNQEAMRIKYKGRFSVILDK